MNKRFSKLLMFAISGIAAFSVIMTACQKEEAEDSFTSSFSVSQVDDYTVNIQNTSSGAYYSVIWDFGNGTRDTTTEKNKTYNVFYPQAGEYEVRLELFGYNGGRSVSVQTVNITKTALDVQFTATPLADDPNLVTLSNTSFGDLEADSSYWTYRSREVADRDEFDAYLPFEGSYDISLTAYIRGVPSTATQSIEIENTDPNYADKLLLTWSDEFDGSDVNTNNWSYDVGATGWGNEELQDYTDGANVTVVDGNLVITAEKVNDNTEVGSYTSARLKTEGKQEFTFGKMEIRANIPEGKGIWPAIWMLGANFSQVDWPACGEMDIMEYVGYDTNTIYSTVHMPDGFGANADGGELELETAEEEFHVYGLLWTEQFLQFYVDDPANIVHTYSVVNKTPNNWPFDEPFFFIMNIAVGGTWGGVEGIDNNIFPQTMEVDYVRVYQEPEPQP